ncbi:MAG: sugar ABC transporter permease [Spirochaetales bacterium]|uniref:Sugar ABC transporter permease n=1 Tax=Candidatus Thalassospirochaeta sargassi TaxID=3119039 RepID=A0AAJ1IIA1_9SPIO|nr:sugar ABC transporter permease [Spirochaetales bacterium]
MRVNKNWKQIILFLLPALILFGVYFIYPLGFVIVTSFSKWNGISAPVFHGFKNYIELFQDETFRLSMRNNIVWALVLGFVQIPLAAVMAMILARKPKGWKFFRTAYFLPNVISQVALAMMWLAIYNAEFGILNNLLEMMGFEGLTRNWLGNMDTAFPAVLVQQVFYIGYFMVVILASRMGIPDSYYEAAEIDGANVFQQEFYITLPMLKPILITTMTLALAYGMRHFESTYLMTNGGPAHSTSVMGILLYRNLGALNYGESNAIGAILIVFGGATIALIRWLFSRNLDADDGIQ